MKFDLNGLNFDWARNIYEDLKNKHLLPVAALLLVALIAVPFVISRGGDEPAPAPVVTASDQTSEVKLDSISVKELRPNGQDIGGTPSNPFEQPNQSQSSSADSTAASTPAASPAGTAPASGSNDAPAADEPSSTETSNDPSSVYELDIKFGTPGDTKSSKNVIALTPFPSADDAYIVYLGAIDKGKTAVFLVSTDVTATGDGVCDPSETTCKTIEMQVGDTETFEVKDDGGTGVFAQYELTIVKIHK